MAFFKSENINNKMMNITRESLNPFSPKVTFGLYSGYSDKLLSKQEIIKSIQNYQNILIKSKRIYLSASVSDTTIVMSNQNEPHLIFNFINYPKFPLVSDVLKCKIEILIKYLMKEFNQNRVVVEYFDETVMLEYSEEIDPKILK